MIDMRDPRGIITFIVRYLALQLGLLVLLVFSFSSGFVLLTFICLLGFFTFFQVLASISPDFLDRAGFWKPIVISVTVLTYVPILWWFGRLVSGIAGSGSDWWLVISWLPFHFVAAFFAWGLRETIRGAGAQNTAISSAPASTVEPGDSENPTSSEDADGGMTKSRDPRGIITFIVRYLVLQVIFLVGLPVSYATDLALIYFFGFMGFITFFQMLIAIPRKFLEKAGWWKPVAIVGAVFSDMAALWFVEVLLGYYFGVPSWGFATRWLHYHFIAALCAWGLREIFRWLSPRDTATPSAPDTPADPAETENLSESGDTEEDTPTDATAVTEVDTDKQ